MLKARSSRSCPRVCTPSVCLERARAGTWRWHGSALAGPGPAMQESFRILEQCRCEQAGWLRGLGKEQLSASALGGSRHRFCSRTERTGPAAPQGHPEARPQHEGAPPPAARLPGHSPTPGNHAESRAKRPRDKAPACCDPKSSQESFTSSQEADEGFLCRSPGTERCSGSAAGSSGGGMARGAVPGGRASGQGEEAALGPPAASPLSGQQHQPRAYFIPSPLHAQPREVREHQGTSMALRGTGATEPTPPPAFQPAPACRPHQARQAQLFPTHGIFFFFFWVCKMLGAEVSMT